MNIPETFGTVDEPMVRLQVASSEGFPPMDAGDSLMSSGWSSTGSKMASYFPAAAGSPVTNTGIVLVSLTIRLSAIQRMMTFQG